MTCPLNRCDGSGWRLEHLYDVTGEATGYDHMVRCKCHGWRDIAEATAIERAIGDGSERKYYLWHKDYGDPVVGFWDTTLPDGGSSWCHGRWLRLNPQPTHYYPRPLAPELPETTERGETHD
jgi:hypothetical protein